jgi:Tol biopolymer transport system component
MPHRLLSPLLSPALVLACVPLASAADPLQPWKNAAVRPVLKDADRHSIHTYYVTSPESPDGSRVLLYTSADPAGHKGDVITVDRTSGAVTVLAKGVVTEDAHRVACQQWVSGGKRVVFHDLRGDEWVVAAVDVATGAERVVVKGRQVGIGSAAGDVVPVVGLHWQADDFADVELLNAATGERETIVTAADVRKAYPELVNELFGDSPVGIYYPILSPDGGRVVFKLAFGKGGDFRSKAASTREGLVCYDVTAKKFLWMQKRWGHPAWSPDSKSVLNVGPTVTDAATGKSTRYTGFPRFPGSHPSFAPDGKLFTTDAIVEPSTSGLWSVVIGDLAAGTSETIHRFDNAQGATSWRRSHPHPAFSPDGRRLYFNASDGKWTRLLVAERGG